MAPAQKSEALSAAFDYAASSMGTQFAAIYTLAKLDDAMIDIRMTDPTYGISAPVSTGKALSGLISYVETGKVPQGSTVVFWHTGGATALFAEPEMVGKIGAEQGSSRRFPREKIAYRLTIW